MSNNIADKIKVDIKLLRQLKNKFDWPCERGIDNFTKVLSEVNRDYLTLSQEDICLYIDKNYRNTKSVSEWNIFELLKHLLGPTGNDLLNKQLNNVAKAIAKEQIENDTTELAKAIVKQNKMHNGYYSCSKISSINKWMREILQQALDGQHDKLLELASKSYSHMISQKEEINIALTLIQEQYIDDCIEYELVQDCDIVLDKLKDPKLLEMIVKAIHDYESIDNS